MSFQYDAEKFDATATDTKAASNAVTVSVERNFGLPTGLYAITIGAYVAFMLIMAVGFQTGQLNLVIAICLVYIAMAFGVPALWTRMKPEDDSRALSWGEFVDHGIQTCTGKMTAKDASAQVLILPVLILFWGIATVIIGAIVMP